ncbi:MAG TPA: glycosyltransferase family 4 protein [Candidatus Binatia bacterium]|nr:glycosyltransferase family 4 protein [Candidatus Binatia bacterium]
MHLGFLCQPFDSPRPPTPNSLGLWVHEVARRVPPDWRVTVYMRGHGRRWRTESVGQIRYRMLPVRYDALAERLFPDRSGAPTFARRSTYRVYAAAAAIDMRLSGVEVVHAINFSQFVPIVRRFAPRTRIVLNMVCEWLSQLDPALVEPRIRRADVVMGCSDHITQLVRARFPTLPVTLRTVENGIDPVAMAPADLRAGCRAPRIVFVGRVSPEKGVHTLIEAMTEVVRRVPDAKLDVLGGRLQLSRSYLVDLSDDPHVRALSRFYVGDDRSVYARVLDDMVAKAGLARHVTFHDAVAYEDVPDFYRDAAVVVNPSLSESFGRSLIEAMAFAVPVVATRVGGMPEIVEHGCEGLLVAPEDPRALAEAIVRVLTDPAGAAAMGRAGRKTVETRYTWDTIAARAINVYKETLRGVR